MTVSDDTREFMTPVPMVLFCPECGLQHVDAPKACTMAVGCVETGVCYADAHDRPDQCARWDNPPHRSHLCAECGHVWRPADVPTVGVAEIETRGKDDYAARRGRAGRCVGGCDGPADLRL